MYSYQLVHHFALFLEGALACGNGFLLALDAWFLKVLAFAYFREDTSFLALFFELLQCQLKRLAFLYFYSRHVKSPPACNKLQMFHCNSE